MIIEVKKTHIRRGEKGSNQSCPIALAVREGLGSDTVVVTTTDVRIGKKKIRLPQEAQDFIDRFDERKSSVQPFSFEL